MSKRTLLRANRLTFCPPCNSLETDEGSKVLDRSDLSWVHLVQHRLVVHPRPPSSSACAVAIPPTVASPRVAPSPVVWTPGPPAIRRATPAIPRPLLSPAILYIPLARGRALANSFQLRHQVVHPQIRVRRLALGCRTLGIHEVARLPLRVRHGEPREEPHLPLAILIQHLLLLLDALLPALPAGALLALTLLDLLLVLWVHREDQAVDRGEERVGEVSSHLCALGLELGWRGALRVEVDEELGQCLVGETLGKEGRQWREGGGDGGGLTVWLTSSCVTELTSESSSS